MPTTTDYPDRISDEQAAITTMHNLASAARVAESLAKRLRAGADCIWDKRAPGNDNGSAWGLAQGVTHYATHIAEVRNGNTRLDGILSGGSTGQAIARGLQYVRQLVA